MGRWIAAIVFLLWAPAAIAADPVLAPNGVLRAAFLAGNPAQATIDPSTGRPKGVAIDLATELARQAGVGVEFKPLNGVEALIASVRDGGADIGFLAADPSRAGPIAFSQVYLRNPQGLAVPRGSVVSSLAELSKAGLRIGVTSGDSIALYLARERPGLRLVMIDDTEIETTRRLLSSGEVDGFAGNRLRLARVVEGQSGLALLPGAIMGVPQAIIAPAGQPARLARLNAFLDQARTSGFLEAAIARAANGTQMEPASAP